MRSLRLAASLIADEAQPGASGGCRYHAVIAAKDEAVGVYLSASSLDEGEWMRQHRIGDRPRHPIRAPWKRHPDRYGP